MYFYVNLFCISLTEINYQKTRNISKGTDLLCKVVELGMQCCGKILSDSFETNKTFPRCIITEFKSKIDVQNHELGWVAFRIVFLINKKRRRKI